MRVTMVRGPASRISIARASRIAALEESDSNPEGTVKDFDVTAERDDTFEATYTSGGYLRVTMEKWVSFDGSHAWASLGDRSGSDEEGLRDLLNRTIASMQPIEPALPSRRTSRSPDARSAQKPCVSTSSSTWLAVPRSSLRIWTQSSVLVATSTVRSATTPPPGQSE